MLDAFKSLGKKYILICCAIMICPLLIILILFGIRSCSGKMSYENYQNKMISAATKYFQKNDKLPTKEGETVTVDLSVLYEDRYIKNPSKALKDDTCEGSVTVRNNGASIKENNGGYYQYIPKLKCDSYQTIYLADEITKNVVTSGSGLYKVANGYIYRGNKVDNYLKLDDKEYRIMGIDADGNIKLIRTDLDTSDVRWDYKYNSEAKSSVGKNIYQDSNILDILISDYKNNKKFSKKAKMHIIAHSTCTGKRTENNLSMDDASCGEMLENQLVQLIGITDYTNASTDPDCNSLRNRSCSNYNYMRNFINDTWTSIVSSENTYEVYYLSGSSIYAEEANNYHGYYIVVYISGNEIYTTGDGSSTNPYIIK